MRHNLSLGKRIDELVEEYGSYRKAAEALGIDHAYLWRLRNDIKTEPGKDLLIAMGLKKIMVVRYERL